MKEVLVKELEVGDVFIDGDTYAVTIPSRLYVSTSGDEFIRVKIIVGPTIDSNYQQAYKDDNGIAYYYIPYDCIVLLCEEQI